MGNSSKSYIAHDLLNVRSPTPPHHPPPLPTLLPTFPPLYVQRFHIQVAGEESDDERNESEIESEPDAAGHRPPTMDEIDSILGLFRRDAEVSRLLSSILGVY